MTTRQKLLIALACTVALIPIPASINAKPKIDQYQQQKKDMDADTYALYRILERIMQTNQINQAISIASRSLCNEMTKECQIISNLPKIGKKDNFYAWALQLIYGTQSSPNADANSQSNLIRMGRSLQNTLATNPSALACIVAHETAHITENHAKSRLAYLADLDSTAASKISSAIKNAHAVKKSKEVWTAIAMGLSAFSSGYNSSAGNYNASYQADINNLMLMSEYNRDITEGSNLAVAYRNIIQENMQQLRLLAPRTMNSLAGLNGLPASLVKRTGRDIDEYLSEFALKYKEFSRKNETEADMIGMEYVANAGIDPKGCIDAMIMLHRVTGDSSTNPLDTHPGEDERISALREKYSSLPNRLKIKFKQPVNAYKILPYVYNKETQIVTISPASVNHMKPGNNDQKTIIDSMLGK